MKIEAELDKQLVITVENQVGTMARISELISSAGINMVAICAYGIDNKGLIMFVTEDNPQAKKVLKSEKFDVREEEVILITLENNPGALQTLAQRIANSEIDLNLIYGSVNKKGKSSRLVIVTEFNNAVLAAIKTL